jgi:hypothetical protein
VRALLCSLRRSRSSRAAARTDEHMQYKLYEARNSYFYLHLHVCRQLTIDLLLLSITTYCRTNACHTYDSIRNLFLPFSVSFLSHLSACVCVSSHYSLLIAHRYVSSHYSLLIAHRCGLSAFHTNGHVHTYIRTHVHTPGTLLPFCVHCLFHFYMRNLRTLTY